MTDIFKILQQAQQMQGRLQQMQDELSQLSVTGTSGGGMVRGADCAKISYPSFYGDFMARAS